MTQDRKKIYKPMHELPGAFALDYILLPYGEFYEKTKGFVNAKKGDIIRFFNGPDVPIEAVAIIKQDKMCDFLCRMRYGIPWEVAFKKWLSYARMEGNGADILSREFCLLVVFNNGKV